MDALPPLAEFVHAERTRLLARLARDGLADITQLPYEKYLSTALWTRIKEWVRRRDQFRCRLCSFEYSPRRLDSLDVHHRRYDAATLAGLDDAHLISLCRGCHTRVEHHADGSRRHDPSAKEVEFARLMRLIERIRSEGLLVRTQRKRNRIELIYCGDPAFLELHVPHELLNAFIFDVQRTHKDTVRLPLPYSSQCLYRASGVRLLDRSTDRTWLTMRAQERTGTIQISRANPLPVEALLVDTFSRERSIPFFWRQVSAGAASVPSSLDRR